MRKIKVRDGYVTIGDYVEFKADVEQVGKVIAIDGNEIKLENKDGFPGDYLRYETTTWMRARDCFSMN